MSKICKKMTKNAVTWTTIPAGSPICPPEKFTKKSPIFLRVAGTAATWIVSLLAAWHVLHAQTTITVNQSTDSSAPQGSFTSVTNCDLRGALNYINTQSASGTYTIGFNIASPYTITLAHNLPPLNFPMAAATSFASNNLTIDGSNGGHQITITGGANARPFFAYQGTVLLQNMSLTGSAVGGAGGSGAGGGGAGLGGALFIDMANVTVNNVAFSNCNATGGPGGAVTSATLGASGGGGGGLGGAGGSPGTGEGVALPNGAGGGGGYSGLSIGGAGTNNITGNPGGCGGGAGAFSAGGQGGTTGPNIAGGGGGGGG
jgi:hypothetical protein